MTHAHKLDRTRPFGQVFGQPGVMYEQDSILYKSNGEPVNPATLVPVNDEPTPPSPRDDTPIKPALVVETPPESDKAKTPLEDMHWTQLKTLVEVNGGTWTNKSDAIAYLKGKV